MKFLCVPCDSPTLYRIRGIRPNGDVTPCPYLPVFAGTLRSDKNPQEVGPKTFVDRVAIKTGEKKRIYESDNTSAFERISTVIDPEALTFIVSRAIPTEVPQHYLVKNGTRVQLTQNKDYTPDLTRALTGDLRDGSARLDRVDRGPPVLRTLAMP